MKGKGGTLAVRYWPPAPKKARWRVFPRRSASVENREEPGAPGGVEPRERGAGPCAYPLSSPASPFSRSAPSWPINPRPSLLRSPVCAPRRSRPSRRHRCPVDRTTTAASRDGARVTLGRASFAISDNVPPGALSRGRGARAKPKRNGARDPTQRSCEARYVLARKRRSAAVLAPDPGRHSLSCRFAPCFRGSGVCTIRPEGAGAIRGWRPRRESNPRRRICSPLRSHSATRPSCLGASRYRLGADWATGYSRLPASKSAWRIGEQGGGAGTRTTRQPLLAVHPFRSLNVLDMI